MARIDDARRFSAGAWAAGELLAENPAERPGQGPASRQSPGLILAVGTNDRSGWICDDPFWDGGAKKRTFVWWPDLADGNKTFVPRD